MVHIESLNIINYSMREINFSYINASKYDVMKAIMKNSLLLLSFSFALICLQSCKDKDESGCTDPNGENYNVDASEDDGSCTYARTKFLGTYGAGESCDGGQAQAVVITIEESPDATNELIVNNETNGITITGVVSGNTITFDDTSVISGVTINVSGSGTYSDDGTEEMVDAEYTITQTNSSGDSSVQDCVSIWGKI